MYTGHFMNNNFDGNGVYAYANGDRVDGLFSAGQLVQINTVHQTNTDDSPATSAEANT